MLPGKTAWRHVRVRFIPNCKYMERFSFYQEVRVIKSEYFIFIIHYAGNLSLITFFRYVRKKRRQRRVNKPLPS